MVQKKENSLLSGFCALDLSDEKGSFCGRLLADLGVDVIKVEKPGGDAARHIGPFYQDKFDPEKSLSWFVLNAGKKGITLNIETDKGRDILLALVKQADFLIESFTPGYLEGLGLGYAKFRKVNPSLVMTSITPFGQDGQYCTYKASDLIVMAMGGWMFTCGDEDRPPVRFSVEQAYLQAGAQAAMATSLAHYYRGITGKGQLVDVSAQEAILWTLTWPIYYWYAAKRVFSRSSYRQKRLNITYRRVYPCKDGFVAYMVGAGLMLGPIQKRLAEIIAKEGKAEGMDEIDWPKVSFENLTQDFIDHWEDVLVRYFMTKTKTELNEMAIANDLFLCPVNNISEIYEYPQLTARGYWKDIEHDELNATLRYPGFWFLSDQLSPGPTHRAPLIGEHNEEIYRMIGVTADNLEILRRDGVI